MTGGYQSRSRAACAAAAGLLSVFAIAGCGSAATHSATAPARSSSSSAATASRAIAGVAPAEPLAAAARQVESQLHGIPEHGLLLGRGGAPVTIVEYGDLECALCAKVHDSVLPAVIARYVRSGRVTLELRPVVEGAASNALALAAYAAGAQGHGWEFVQLSYRRSGAGGAVAEPAQALVRALGLDPARWRADLGRASWKAAVAGALDVARVAGFNSYPVFLVSRTASDTAKTPAPYIVLTAPSGARPFDRAIAEALSRRG